MKYKCVPSKSLEEVKQSKKVKCHFALVTLPIYY